LLTSATAANANSNAASGIAGTNTNVSKAPLAGGPPLRMGPGNPLGSPINENKLGTTSGGSGYGTNQVEEKSYGNGPNGNTAALGMGGQGRLGLDANGNSLALSKRLPKEETV